MYFIDESGSMPTFKSMKWSNRYFVIALVHTNDPEQVKKIYKKSLLHLKKYYPQYFSPSGELKGSDAPPFAKEYLIQRLLNKTDISVGYMLVDNWNIKDPFRESPGRSFNYLIKLVMISHKIGARDKLFLRLKVDNRNTALNSLKSLEDYLHQELVLGEGITNVVEVEFCESANYYNIQVADLMANTIYQYHRYETYPFPDHKNISRSSNDPCPENIKYLYDLIKERIFFSQRFPFSKPLIGKSLA